VLLPGLVDSHVHANEPGRTAWEGLDTATRAAVAGGVTTIVDMPLNSLPPTVTCEALAEKQAAARDRVWSDVAFWGGAIPGNEADLPALHGAGVCGVKAFLADSGVPEFPHLDAAGLAAAMAICARHGITRIVHAELPGPLRAAPADRRYASWLASRPAEAEVEAIALLVRLARGLAASGPAPRVHVVHLSAAEAIPLVAEARAAGLPFSAETCPHYLALAAEDIADGATLCKCAPPIRGAANRERLWEGLAARTIGLVASDHSPSPPEGKALDDGDFARAWGGISSLGLGLAVMWTEASARGFDLADLARWMALEPARLAGLEAAKGALAPGRDADFALFDADATWTVDPARLWTRHRITPYAGRTLRGRVRATYLRGEAIFTDDDTPSGGAFAGQPGGRLLARGEGRA
jgi:allantoinase